MSIKQRLNRNWSIINFCLIVFGTVVFFIAFYFNNKNFEMATITENLNSPRLYLCLLFSFIASLLLNFSIGKIRGK